MCKKKTSSRKHGIDRRIVKLTSLAKPDRLAVRFSPNHICLLTDDGTSLTTSVANMLVQQGWSKIVILGLPSSIVSQSKVDNNFSRFSLSSTTEEAIIQSLSEIKEAHGPVGAFIHLHPMLSKTTDSISVFRDDEKNIVKIIYFLAKHLKKDLTDVRNGARSYFITLTRMNGCLGFGPPTSQSVLAGGFSGLIKTANIEWGSVYCRSIDVEPKTSNNTVTAALNSELLDPDVRLTEVGYSVEGRYTLAADIENLDIDNMSDNEIGASSVFLVAGGAKGVTATCIKALAKRFKPSFILLGRSDNSVVEPEWSQGIDDEMKLKKRCMEAFQAEGEKPTPVKIANRLKPILAQREINKTIKSLESAGSKVEYLSADILDTEDLKKKLQAPVEMLGEITGLVHGAGILADKLIVDKTELDYQIVFDTKIKGLQVLMQAVSPDKLKHLVLFSSAAGFYGNEAQSDYATANEILNKYAHLFKQNHPKCHVVSFNWGPWDGGMVTPQLKRMFEEKDIKVIPPDAGSAIMVDELALKDKSAVQVVVGSSMVIPRNPDSDLHSYTITRNLDLEENLFLHHHVIGNEPVLPIICALSWMADTCEKLYPGYRFVACEDTKVLKGIVFDRSPQSGEYQVKVDELDKSQTDSILFHVQVSSEAGKKTVFHYSSKIHLARKAPEMLYAGDFNLDALNKKPGSDFYADGTLFHGSTFQIVTHQLNIDQRRLTLSCQAQKLDRKQQGQFHSESFNSFADDVQLQALLIWARFKYQAASLPLSIKQAKIYKKTPFDKPFYVTMNVQSASKSKLVADVCSHDEKGKVYTQLNGAEVVISKALNDKFMRN